MPNKHVGDPLQKPLAGRRLVEKRLLPVLNVDWSQDPADLILPCTLTRQAKGLGWRANEVRATNQTYGLYESLPRICNREKCFWRAQCPTAQHGYPFEGLRCPLDTLYVYRQFVLLARELALDPEDHVDLTTVTDLVRIDLQIHWIDQRVQLEGLDLDQDILVNPGRGDTIKQKVINPLLHLQRSLRADRNKLYQRLIADRSEKKKVELQTKASEENVLDLFARLRQSRQAKIAETPRELPDPDVFEAELVGPSSET